MSKKDKIKGLLTRNTGSRGEQNTGKTELFNQVITGSESVHAEPEPEPWTGEPELSRGTGLSEPEPADNLTGTGSAVSEAFEIPLTDTNHKTVNPETHKPVELMSQPWQQIPIEISRTPDTAKRKKATFELNENLHIQLKMYAARQGKKMVEIVEEALYLYLLEKSQEKQSGRPSSKG